MTQEGNLPKKLIFCFHFALHSASHISFTEICVGHLNFQGILQDVFFGDKV
jgi:hypothetical protein